MTQEHPQEFEMTSPTPEEYAAIYARRSTKLENNSINSQIALAKDVVKENKLIVYDIYNDKESATKFHPLHRPGFKKLLYDAMEGKFKTVVVFRRDRLARKVEDLMEIKNTFKKHGIKIIYSNKGEFQADENIYMSSFIENIIMSVDELEPSILAERIASGKKEKRERGEYVCGGKHLFGYDRIDKNGKTFYEPNEHEAKIIRKMYEKYLSLDELAPDFDSYLQEINQISNDKTRTLKDIEKILLKPVYGKMLILKDRDDEGNKIYTSDLIAKNIKTDAYEINQSLLRDCINVTSEVISKEKWFEAVLKWRRLTPERNIIPEDEKNYIFKDLLKCNKCNKKIILSKGSYLCPKCLLSIEADYLVEDLIDKILDDILTEDAIDTYYKETLEKTEDDIEDIEKEISKVKKNQSQLLVDLIKNYSPSNKNALLKNSDLKHLIDEEKIKQEKISDLKTDALSLKLSIEKLKHIIRINHKTVLINMLRKNIDGTQFFLSSIIQEVGITSHDGYDIKFNHK